MYTPLSGVIKDINQVTLSVTICQNISVYYTYVLISESDQQLYIGSTPDLKARITKHNSGYVRSTKDRRPLKLIYYEAYLSSTDARKRELFLKGGRGHNELKIQLEQTFKSVKYKNRY